MSRRLTPREWQNYVAQTYFSVEEYNQVKWAEEFQGERDKTVVHIPARSGSLRLADKNIMPLCGVPLLAYTILVAKAMPVDRVIVNTDSIEYAKIAEQYGAEVPFLRPKELASSHAPPGVAFFYAFMHMATEGYPLSICVDMYPTTPFRNVQSMCGYLQMTKDEGHCGTIYSPEYDLTQLYREGEKLFSCSEQKLLGGVYQFKQTSHFVGFKVNTASIRTNYYTPITNPIELIDIDTREDFLMAEHVINNDLYKFGIDIC